MFARTRKGSRWEGSTSLSKWDKLYEEAMIRAAALVSTGVAEELKVIHYENLTGLSALKTAFMGYLRGA
jgi:hypothetical protein